MYLTTQERWDQTADDNQGPGPDQWPYTFEHAPEQLETPVISGRVGAEIDQRGVAKLSA
jgi:hypothetical protein